MGNESYKALEESIINHKLVIDDLIRENEALKLQLEASDTQVAHLTVKVEQLENGQQELVVQLDDANGEVNRIGMVLKHRTDHKDAINRYPKSND